MTGSATATNPGSITSPTATSNTQTVAGYVVSPTPTTTNTGSTNQEFTFAVTNRGCANLNQVAITYPGGAGAFVYGGDGYSIVGDTTGNQYDENWTQSGTTFTAQLNNAPAADPSRVPVGSAGNYSLVFSSTPSAAGTFTFNFNLTDVNGLAQTLNVSVPVSAFGTGTVNSAGQGTWREVVQ